MWRQQLDFNRSEGAQEPFTLDDIQVCPRLQ